MAGWLAGQTWYQTGDWPRGISNPGKTFSNSLKAPQIFNRQYKHSSCFITTLWKLHLPSVAPGEGVNRGLIKTIKEILVSKWKLFANLFFNCHFQLALIYPASLIENFVSKLITQLAKKNGETMQLPVITMRGLDLRTIHCSSRIDRLRRRRWRRRGLTYRLDRPCYYYLSHTYLSTYGSDTHSAC